MNLSKTLIAVALVSIALPAVAQTYPYSYPTYPTYPAISACPTLFYNLYVGRSDRYTQGQVSALQQFLSTQGYYQPVTGYFGAMTRANVAQFQRAQSVYPITGGVGPLTRAAIARVCGAVVPPVPPPQPTGSVSITGVSGPNSLTVGQSGTWQVSTNAPQGTPISLSVRWGDEVQYPYPASSAAQSAYVSQQNTFTHSYQTAGTYTITFTASDQYGRSNSSSVTVQVSGAATTAGFTATPTQGAAPLYVNFGINTTTGNDMNTLSIDFGDGQTGKPNTIYCFAAPCNPAMTAQHTYTTNGTYTAKLLRDNNYCQPGMYCTLMYREPTVLGVVVITVTSQ